MGSLDKTGSQSPLTAVAQQMKVSATLEINELVRENLRKGKDIVHLGFGEATFPIHPEVLQAHRQASQVTSYLPVAGLDKLRQSIALSQSRRLGRSIESSQVVIAPGSKPLLFALFDIFKGDVLLPRPSWVSYEPQVLHAGKKLYWVETDEEDRHTITASALESAFRKALQEGADPRVMLVNSPSNPTGQAYSAATVRTITEFCEKNAITLISDEIYSDIFFDGKAGPSPCAGNHPGAGQIIMTGGLSKTYSAGGWRIGFAIFPSTEFGMAVQKAILAYASECWSAASSPAQEAAAIAFSPSVEMDLYREQVRNLHRQCTLTLYEALKEVGLAVARPSGAFYVYPSFHPFSKQLQAMGIHSSVALCRWLINECGIAVLPGSAFGEDDSGLSGGRYRVRMATSYLYFKDQKDRYNVGYSLLKTTSSEGSTADLPMLDKAIAAIDCAVAKLKAS